ncbi:hypothetical protein B0O80DRAFT_428936 [Mortierella sp. GBAus27b]|nr:hypothetical protein BGX31_005831 [Mortierella sp. GBA43]KAI8349518.1 hypothetical protein B0O80DRAFT_428936 [Mortierella sp. GBAus27b]
MFKKDHPSNFWNHIVRDSKGIARLVINKILNKPSVGSTASLSSHSDTQNYSTATRSSSVHYESLWEVQLALREIPGMFEENILKPCHPEYPLSSSPPIPQQPCFVPQNMPRRSHQLYSFPSTIPAPPFAAAMSFEDRSEYPFSHFHDEEVPRYMDDDNNDEYWTECRYHHHSMQDYNDDDATYAPWSLQSEGSAKSDHRQDRKDSGVFVHDDEDGILLNLSFLPKEWGSKMVDGEKVKGMLDGHDRVLSLRELVMGEDLQLLENGSIPKSLPSLMANVSSFSTQM